MASQARSAADLPAELTTRLDGGRAGELGAPFGAAGERATVGVTLSSPVVRPAAAAAEGCYTLVTPEPSAELPHPAAFYVLPDPSAPVDEAPADQAALYADVTRTLQVLETLATRRAKTAAARADAVRGYYAQLRAIVEIGLVGVRARPAFARPLLTTLQAHILEREAGFVKTGYMFWLAKVVAAVAVPALVVAAFARAAQGWRWLRETPGLLSYTTTECLALLVAGCAVGTWLSFGARKPTFTFDDLRVLEQDYLGPKTRVAFAVLLTVALALLFSANVIAVSVGSVNTADVFRSPAAAGIIGLLCGLSEQALSRQLATQAKRIFRDPAPQAVVS